MKKRWSMAPPMQGIVKRANDGRAAARKRGVHMGRKPKLTEMHTVCWAASLKENS
jgi:hypothetical protein